MDFSHLRIALFSSDLPAGGSTVFLIHLAGEIVRRGGQAGIFSFGKENPHHEDFRRLNAPVFSAGEKGDLIFEDRLSAILEQLAIFQPHVIIANLGSVAFEVLRYAPKGVLRVGMHHSDLSLIYDMVAGYTPWMDLLVGVSKRIVEKSKARRDSSPQVRYVYIPCGVEFSKVQRAGHETATAPLRLLYLGRLEHEAKRVRLFPRISEQLQQAGIPFRWTLIGDGSQMEFLRQEMPSRPDAEIIFTGNLPIHEVADLLPQQEVFLLASDYEGLPLSLLEAMGAGVVPVISDLPSGVREVVTPDVGILVDPQDIEGYAKGIAHLYHHRKELAEKSVRCREKVLATFSIAAMGDRWLSHLPSPEEAANASKWPTRPSLKPQIGLSPLRSLPPVLTLRRFLKRRAQ